MKTLPRTPRFRHNTGSELDVDFQAYVNFLKLFNRCVGNTAEVELFYSQIQTDRFDFGDNCNSCAVTPVPSLMIS